MQQAYVSDRYPRQVAGGREAGLSRFFAGVYGWMAAGVAVSGAMALVCLSEPVVQSGLLRSPMVTLVTFLLQMGIVVTFTSRASQISTFAAANLFFAYAALMGVLLAPLAYVYTGAALTQSFLVSGATFGGLALYGLTTKRSLSAMQSFVTMGLVGGMVLLLVNAFLQNAALDFVVNMGLLLVFMVLAAKEHQTLKLLYAQSGAAGNLSLLGAFQLYVTFINLTLTMLRLFGGRRDNN